MYVERRTSELTSRTKFFNATSQSEVKNELCEETCEERSEAYLCTLNDERAS